MKDENKGAEMSTFTAKCPRCNGEFEADTEWIGREGECPFCGQTIPISRDAKASLPNSEALSSAAQGEGSTKRVAKCPKCLREFDAGERQEWEGICPGCDRQTKMTISEKKIAPDTPAPPKRDQEKRIERKGRSPYVPVKKPSKPDGANAGFYKGLAVGGIALVVIVAGILIATSNAEAQKQEQARIAAEEAKRKEQARIDAKEAKEREQARIAAEEAKKKEQARIAAEEARIAKEREAKKKEAQVVHVNLILRNGLHQIVIPDLKVSRVVRDTPKIIEYCKKIEVGSANFERAKATQETVEAGKDATIAASGSAAEYTAQSFKASLEVNSKKRILLDDIQALCSELSSMEKTAPGMFLDISTTASASKTDSSSCSFNFICPPGDYRYFVFGGYGRQMLVWLLSLKKDEDNAVSVVLDCNNVIAL